MSEQTYRIKFDMLPLATVAIDAEKALEPIKQMVDFWMGSEDRMAEAGGCAIRAWLKQLAEFIISRDRPPRDGDEGWCVLDGTHGIKLVTWNTWEPDYDGIEIEEVKPKTKA